MPGKSVKDRKKELDTCVNFILDRIYLREINPGDEIRKSHFPDKFAKATVDRCLNQLVSDGIATLDGVRTKVVHHDHKRQQTIIAARIVTEACVVSSLAEHLTDVSEANAINAKMSQLLEVNAGELPSREALQFVVLDRNFHLSLADADNNSVARRIVSEGYTPW